MKYEANDCENTSFVHSETRTIILHTVNPSLYENKTLMLHHEWRFRPLARLWRYLNTVSPSIPMEKNRGFKSPMSQSLEKKFAGGREGSKESVTILTIRN